MRSVTKHILDHIPRGLTLVAPEPEPARAAEAVVAPKASALPEDVGKGGVADKENKLEKKTAAKSVVAASAEKWEEAGAAGPVADAAARLQRRAEFVGLAPIMPDTGAAFTKAAPQPAAEEVGEADGISVDTNAVAEEENEREQVAEEENEGEQVMTPGAWALQRSDEKERRETAAAAASAFSRAAAAAAAAVKEKPAAAAASKPFLFAPSISSGSSLDASKPASTVSGATSAKPIFGASAVPSFGGFGAAGAASSAFVSAAAKPTGFNFHSELRQQPEPQALHEERATQLELKREQEVAKPAGHFGVGAGGHSRPAFSAAAAKPAVSCAAVPSFGAAAKPYSKSSVFDEARACAVEAAHAHAHAFAAAPSFGAAKPVGVGGLAGGRKSAPFRFHRVQAKFALTREFIDWLPANCQKEVWPSSLNAYVSRLLASCTTDQHRDHMQIQLGERLEALTENAPLLDRINWHAEPNFMPAIVSFKSPPGPVPYVPGLHRVFVSPVKIN